MARRTIAREITARGAALHAGGDVRMTLLPGRTGEGIVFSRVDLGGAEVAARYDRVAETRLGTVIAEGDVRVGVIEHLMAAVAGAEIDDLVVQVDGPEPPILDGDALSYLELIERAGIVQTAGERRAIKILEPVSAEGEDASASLEPADELAFDFEITFDSAAIGDQRFEWPFSPAGFRAEIAGARTFGFLRDLEGLRKAGLARGASLENTLAIDGDTVVNRALMRFPDEFVRHKILDALGDMALTGAPLVGRFVGRRSGHALNNTLLRAVFARPSSYAFVTLD